MLQRQTRTCQQNTIHGYYLTGNKHSYYIYLHKLYINETHTCHAVASRGQRVRTAQTPRSKPHSTSLHVMALAIELNNHVPTVKFATHRLIATHTEVTVLRRDHCNTDMSMLHAHANTTCKREWRSSACTCSNCIEAQGWHYH